MIDDDATRKLRRGTRHDMHDCIDLDGWVTGASGVTTPAPAASTPSCGETPATAGLSDLRCNWLRHAERCLAGKDQQ
jgi:hypothetical protein